MVKLLSTFLKLTFMLGAVLFTLIYISTQWQEIAAHLESIDWINVVIAGSLYIIGMNLLPLGVVLGFHFTRFEVTIPSLYRAFAISQIIKYLPGGIWALPGRAFLYNRLGIPASVGVNNLVSELILMIAGATIWGVVGLELYLGEVRVLSAVILAVAVAGIFVIRLFHNKSSIILRIPLPRRIKQWLAKIDWYFSFKQSLFLVIFYIAIWGVFGVAFEYVLIAVGISSNETLYFVGVFAAAWTLGFVFPLTPGGIGIREAVLVSGLAVFMNDPLPVVAAILSRILWTIAELFSLGFAALMNFAATRHTKQLRALHQETL